MLKGIMRGLAVVAGVAMFWYVVLDVREAWELERERDAAWGETEDLVCSSPTVEVCLYECRFVQAMLYDPEKRDTPETAYAVERHLQQCVRKLKLP